MPTYLYRNRNTGYTVEIAKPMADRDDCPPGYERIAAVPIVPRMGRAGRQDPQEADIAIPRALKQHEQVVGADALCRGAGFTAEQLKRAWPLTGKV